MKRIIIALTIILSLFLISCTSQNPVACTMDAKICPDGSAVGRIAPDCKFAECPLPNCDYNDISKSYITKEKNCVADFLCERGSESFSDECGCGCKDIPFEDKKIYCDKNNRPQVCTLEYMPVCGWFDESIKCFKYPCASTFGNKCHACAAENVAFWTDGECPK